MVIKLHTHIHSACSLIRAAGLVLRILGVAECQQLVAQAIVEGTVFDFSLLMSSKDCSTLSETEIEVI